MLYLESPHFFHSWHPSARLVTAFDIPPIETIWSREFYTYMARTERDVVYTYTTGRAEDSARFQRLFIDADNTATRMCAHRKNIRPLVPLTFLSLRGYVDKRQEYQAPDQWAADKQGIPHLAWKSRMWIYARN